MPYLAHQLQSVCPYPSDPFCGSTVLCLWGLIVMVLMPEGTIIFLVDLCFGQWFQF